MVKTLRSKVYPIVIPIMIVISLGLGQVMGIDRAYAATTVTAPTTLAESISINPNSTQLTTINIEKSGYYTINLNSTNGYGVRGKILLKAGEKLYINTNNQAVGTSQTGGGYTSTNGNKGTARLSKDGVNDIMIAGGQGGDGGNNVAIWGKNYREYHTYNEYGNGYWQYPCCHINSRSLPGPALASGYETWGTTGQYLHNYPGKGGGTLYTKNTDGTITSSVIGSSSASYSRPSTAAYLCAECGEYTYVTWAENVTYSGDKLTLGAIGGTGGKSYVDANYFSDISIGNSSQITITYAANYEENILEFINPTCTFTPGTTIETVNAKLGNTIKARTGTSMVDIPVIWTWITTFDGTQEGEYSLVGTVGVMPYWITNTSNLIPTATVKVAAPSTGMGLIEIQKELVQIAQAINNQAPTVTVVKGLPFEQVLTQYDNIESGSSSGITVTNTTIGDNSIKVAGTLNTVGWHEIFINGYRFIFHVVDEPNSSNVKAVLN